MAAPVRQVVFSSASQEIIIMTGKLTGAILQEDGFDILLETGSRLLQEQE